MIKEFILAGLKFFASVITILAAVVALGWKANEHILSTVNGQIIQQIEPIKEFRKTDMEYIKTQFDDLKRKNDQIIDHLIKRRN